MNPNVSYEILAAKLGFDTVAVSGRGSWYRDPFPQLLRIRSAPVWTKPKTQVIFVCAQEGLGFSGQASGIRVESLRLTNLSAGSALTCDPAQRTDSTKRYNSNLKMVEMRRWA